MFFLTTDTQPPLDIPLCDEVEVTLETESDDVAMTILTSAQQIEVTEAVYEEEDGECDPEVRGQGQAEETSDKENKGKIVE